MASVDSNDIQQAEDELFQLMSKDPYFGGLELQVGEVQCQGHLFSTRDMALLLPTVESVEATFEERNTAMSRLDALAKAVVQSSNDWRSQKKALAKARAAEEKEIDRETKRQEKLQQKEKDKEEKERQKRIRALQEAQDKGAAAEEDQDKDPKDPNKRRKKRRTATIAAGQFNPDDPAIVKGKFGDDYQMQIFEGSDFDFCQHLDQTPGSCCPRQVCCNCSLAQDLAINSVMMHPQHPVVMRMRRSPVHKVFEAHSRLCLSDTCCIATSAHTRLNTHRAVQCITDCSKPD